MHEPVEQLILPEFGFDNTFVHLSERFYTRLSPTPVSEPTLVKLNSKLAINLGLDPQALQTTSGAGILGGNYLPQGSEPLAMVYAGHQFGGWVPQLGDGRAILLGEVLGKDGRRRDIQLKGAGPTPYSRMGDGRAALGPVLREYIVSEAMWALGIPTTRSLAAVVTGDTVFREQALPGAIVARVAESHVRVGTFQFFSARSDTAGVKEMADYVIARHFSDIDSTHDKYELLLNAVVMRQAALIAQWQLVGFIHGVMNTDNTSIVGETIDYGPCAFMDKYDPKKVFSSIDQLGRYAYANQPGIGYWNLGCFGQTLLPLIEGDVDASLKKAQEIVGQYPALFQEAYLKGLRKKLGLQTEQEGDRALAEDLLSEMAKEGVDYTVTFRNLSALGLSIAGEVRQAEKFFEHSKGFQEWIVRWNKRLREDGVHAMTHTRVMRSANPAVIPRNHLVEEAIKFAVADGDYSHFHKLVEMVERPYDEAASSTKYALPPRPEEEVTQTFCGT
jgi:uncharacterized protein YdiU (UPF0061 family)